MCSEAVSTPWSSSQVRYSPQSSPAAATSTGRSPSAAMPKEMLAATPPRRMSRWSTRKDSETRCSWSGSSWSANRPGKVIRWSVANDPVTMTGTERSSCTGRSRVADRTMLLGVYPRTAEARLDQRQHRVENNLERAHTAGDLGHEQTALHPGEKGERQVVRVAVELTAGVHCRDTRTDARLPSQEARGHRQPRLGVALGDLAAKRPDGTAAPALQPQLVLDHGVTPGAQADQAVQPQQVGALLLQD